MRIVLSKKGTDSEFGGIPSPVFQKEDGTTEIFSLPIPQGMPGLLKDAPEGDIKKNEIVEHFRLSEDFPKIYCKTQGKALDYKEKFQFFHIDPDIRKKIHSTHTLQKGWKCSSFGQSDKAMQSLAKKLKIGIDTSGIKSLNESVLFLFYGWYAFYKESEGGIWKKDGGSFNLLWGYMFANRVIVETDATQNDIKNFVLWHPHAYHLDGFPNCLFYYEKEEDEVQKWMTALNIPETYGVFQSYHPELRLTLEDCSFQNNGRGKDNDSNFTAWKTTGILDEGLNIFELPPKDGHGDKKNNGYWSQGSFNKVNSDFVLLHSTLTKGENAKINGTFGQEAVSCKIEPPSGDDAQLKEEIVKVNLTHPKPKGSKEDTDGILIKALRVIFKG